MGLSISAAARQWGVGRETIYRRKKGGELSFLDTKPPTIDPAEMLRVFGEPGKIAEERAAKKRIEMGAVELAAMRLEVQHETLKVESARLAKELTAAKLELEKERDAARSERDKFLDMLKEKDTSQRLLEQKMMEITTPKSWWARVRGK